jgi:GT2 family glycosyltransferase
METKPPHVTVVVCTYNRALGLRDALDSLVELQTREFAYDVLVVDNASTDSTPDVIREFTSRYPQKFRSVREPKPGVSAARNAGVRAAGGDWVAFFDDDQLADRDWLAELMALAARRNVSLAGGSVLLKLPYGTVRKPAGFCRVLLGETVGRNTEQPYTSKMAPGCGNMLVHTAVFQKVGLFDETLTTGGEDTDLYRRIRAAGYAGWFTPSALVWHVIPADRLEVDSLEWTASRIGGHVARRETRESGLAARCLWTSIRMAQWLVAQGPKRLRARLKGDLEAVVAQRCWRRFLTAYLQTRLPVFSLLPKRMATLDFRSRGAALPAAH